MTAFRLVDADNENVQKLLYEMETLSPLGAAILNRSQVIVIFLFLIKQNLFIDILSIKIQVYKISYILFNLADSNSTGSDV